MKFLQFLRKIDLCVLIPYLAYAFFVNCMTVFVEYNYLIFDIPYIAVVLGCVFILGASVFIYKMYHRDFSDKKWMIIYLSWFVFIPIVYNLILLILLDSLYDFSGVFLGGLGSFIYRLLVIAICVIALIIFFVVRFIVSKRHAKGKYADPEKIIIIKNVFNIALLVNDELKQS